MNDREQPSSKTCAWSSDKRGTCTLPAGHQGDHAWERDAATSSKQSISDSVLREVRASAQPLIESGVATDMGAVCPLLLTRLCTELIELREENRRYENGRVVLTGEIERLRMAERLNVDTVANFQKRIDELERTIELVADGLAGVRNASDEDAVDVLRAALDGRAVQPPSAAPIAWRRLVDSPYTLRPEWHYTHQQPTVSPEKWEPVYARPSVTKTEAQSDGR